MIPNTDINCGRCATAIYSDCVMWSGGNLPCVTLLQDCCDTTLTKVIELLGDYVCDLSNVANYNIPVCMESFAITDFKGMQNAMMQMICNQQRQTNVTGLTWGCTPSGITNSLPDSVQAIINQLNNQLISYNTSTDFTITGEGCNKILSITPKSINVTGLTWGCTTSGTTSLLNDTFQAVINQLNSQYISYNTSTDFTITGSGCSKVLNLKPITITGLTWGCVTSGSTASLKDTIQALINQENTQKISYNTTTDFTITGTECNKVLNLQQDNWVPFQPVDIQGYARTGYIQDNGWELIDGGNKVSPAYNGNPSMWYRKDSLGNVSIVGVFGISGITSAWKRTISGGSPTTNTVKMTGIVDQNTTIYNSSSTVAYTAGTWMDSNGNTGTIEWSKDIGSNANTAIKFIYIPRVINGIDITPYIGSTSVIRAVTTFSWGYNLNPVYYHSSGGSIPPNNVIDSRAHVVIPCTLSKNDTSFSQNVLKVAMLPKWDEQVEVGMSIYLRIDYNVNN